MNMLSWLIYGAEVIQNATSVFGAIAAVLAAVCIVLMIFSIFSLSETDDEGAKEVYAFMKKIAKVAIIPLVICVLGIFVPSQNTIYMIAASEVAEAGYKSGLGEKVQAIVEEKINDILATEKVDK